MNLRARLTRTVAAGLFWALGGLPVASQASSQLATDMGCTNCHGAYPRGGAPSFERLAERYSKHKGDPAAEARAVDHWRTGEWLEHVDAHERPTPETAKVLMHWLVEGAK
jgi:cytochrome c